MSSPTVLVVDDSEAIRSFVLAALERHYSVATAANGREALDRLSQLDPALVLLDLSMPVMDGEVLFARMRATPRLAGIPVVIISSETSRAEACLAAGAHAFLQKPLSADSVAATVGQVIEEVRQKQRQGSMALLVAAVASQEVAIPLLQVRAVLDQVLTRSLPTGPSYLAEVFELRGKLVCVLDLASRLGVAHACALPDRKLVVIESEGLWLALSVDRVQDPEEIAAEHVIPHESLGGSDHGPLRQTLLAMAQVSGRWVPVLDPQALLSGSLAREIRSALDSLETELGEKAG